VTLIQPTRILILGNGGREHALAWKLSAEPGVNDVFVTPARTAITALPRVRGLAADPEDPGAIVDLARRHSVELVVVGPEAPLAAGVADALIDAAIPVFGPTADAARIETSKAFCRELAASAGVPMAFGRSFEGDDRRSGLAFARELAERGGVVIKDDGLAAGKGVTVCETSAAADRAIQAVGGRVVVEERLVGREASVIAICDGRTAVALPPARDHKRLLDGDAGPNTGGMGAYSPLQDLPDVDAAELVERFHRPILAELARRGTPFRGALYGGLMLTADGPRLLEFNARFGDPETQVILPRLARPLGPILLAAALGSLPPLETIPVLPVAAVGIVLAAEGYPLEPRVGAAIEGLDSAVDAPGALVFHSGTGLDDAGTFRTNGGRVLTVVGRGADLAAARDVAERAADAISWPGMQRRHDIALHAPVAEGVA
jgi:phosphoribosylamine--glycine ligase